MIVSHLYNSQWYTPASVFEALGAQFDLDVSCPADLTHIRTPAKRFISENSLDQEWEGFVWMNPPYGGRNAVAPWMEKFFRHGNGLALTTDRTSALWFWDAWKRADLVLFTRKIRFVGPDGKPGVSPSNGSAIWASGAAGCAALRRAAGVGFGILGAPENVR